MIIDAVSISLSNGQSTTYTFSTKDAAPDLVIPMKNTPISASALTATSVTFTNTGVSDTVTFILFFFGSEATRAGNNYTTLALGWDGTGY